MESKGDGGVKEKWGGGKWEVLRGNCKGAEGKEGGRTGGRTRKQWKAREGMGVLGGNFERAEREDCEGDGEEGGGRNER